MMVGEMSTTTVCTPFRRKDDCGVNRRFKHSENYKPLCIGLYSHFALLYCVLCTLYNVRSIRNLSEE